MKFPLFVAKRYLFSKSSNNAINIITIISAISIIAGSAALFIVLTGFSGLKDFSLSFSSVFDPDLKVLPATGKTFVLSEEQENKLNNLIEINNFSKVIEERSFLEFKGKNHIAYLKGVDENYTKVNPVDSTIFYGGWITPEEPLAVIGFGVSRILSIGVNNYTNLLQVMVPKPGTGQITDPTQAFNSSKLVVSGIFQVNEELDEKYIFTNLGYARELLNYDQRQLSALEIKMNPESTISQAKDDIQSILGSDVIVKSRIQLNDKLYKMLNAENLAVYLIFTLVLIIALFNLIGSIIMIILDKKENIKTLHSLGATLTEIRRVFFLQGALMTIFGGLLGITLGALIVGAQIQFDLVMITSSLPYPMQFKFINFVSVFATISLLGLLASLAASSRINPRVLD